MTWQLSFERPGTPAAEAAIVLLERELGIGLPADYRRFLLTVGGGKPVANVLDGDPRVGVHRFLELGSTIEERRGQYVDRIPQGYLPVADAEGGNLVLLALHGHAYGSMWFWDHEREAEEGQQPTERNLAKVADSFDELLARLRPVRVHDGGIVSAWIDPEFLERHRAP